MFQENLITLKEELRAQMPFLDHFGLDAALRSKSNSNSGANSISSVSGSLTNPTGKLSGVESLSELNRVVS